MADKTYSRFEENQTNDLSLKDIFVKVKRGISYLKSKWLLIAAIAFACGVCGFLYAKFSKPTYTASCNFVLEEGAKGGLGQYASLASLAGIELGQSGGGVFQGDNIIELYKSRLMLEKTLLTPIIIDNKEQLLIERYIEFNNLRPLWKKNDRLDNISFKGDPDQFNRKQDSLITNIVNHFNKNFLYVNKPDKKLSIIKVSFSNEDEIFAKAFTEQLVTNVNNFYVQTKTKKSLQSVKVLQHQADSIKGNLNSSINSLASAIDATPNPNPALSILRASSQRRQVDVQSNGAIYAEIVKDLELAKVSLRQETPLIQVIDRPVLPLAVDKPGKIKFFAIGFILGAVLTTIFLSVRKVSARLLA